MHSLEERLSCKEWSNGTYWTLHEKVDMSTVPMGSYPLDRLTMPKLILITHNYHTKINKKKLIVKDMLS